MRTKPTYSRLSKAAGRRPKKPHSTTAAVLRHVLESEQSFVKRALASDAGRIKRVVEKAPATPLVAPRGKQDFERAVQPPRSSSVPAYSGRGHQLSDSEPEFSGRGQRLPRRGRGEAILERGRAQRARDVARLR